jgi:hypothetical protein
MRRHAILPAMRDFPRFLPPAACAACLLAAAAALAGEIPAYEDFSHPLSFSALSGGREAEGGTLPAREDIAISFLAQDEDTWFDRLLVHHPAGSSGIAPYTPPSGGNSARDALSARNWLSDALVRGLPGQADPSGQDADSGDWLSGDLARMARKRTAKETAEKERLAAEEETAADASSAALWSPPDSSRFQPFASADAAARGAATNAPGGRDGGARVSFDTRRNAADARDGAQNDFAADGTDSPARDWSRSAWTDGTPSAGNSADASAPWKSPSAEKDDEPAWMKAILEAGRPSDAAARPWSLAAPASGRGYGTPDGFAPHTGTGGASAAQPAGGGWGALPRSANPAEPAAAAWTDAGTSGWSAPSPAAETHVGWQGGWNARQSLSETFALPAAPTAPLPSASPSSTMPTNAALPRPAWY